MFDFTNCEEMDLFSVLGVKQPKTENAPVNQKKKAANNKDTKKTEHHASVFPTNAAISLIFTKLQLSPELFGGKENVTESEIQIAQLIKDDFYIIPSSVHEVLCVPVHYISDREFLEGMLTDVNQTQVLPNEILEWHVYRYRMATGEIEY